MNFNTSNYFAYKKHKNEIQTKEIKKPLSKLNFIFQLFLATFIIIFIIIVIVITKYTSKMDIECSKDEVLINQEEIENSPIAYDNYNDEQKTIDKRLLLIQQEENAPSEAKIIEKNKEIIIDEKYIKKEPKIIEKKDGEKSSIHEPKLKLKLKEEFTKNPTEEKEPEKTNIIITSKVLIGRYSTLEEAQLVQKKLKELNPNLSPFVKKYGDIYSIQMGSYQDFQIAKHQAQLLKSKGYDVWIFQQ